MDSFSCPECRVIDHELREAARAARERQPGRRMTPQELAAWLDGLNEEDCAHMRETSSLWKTWRKMNAHRILTGHSSSNRLVSRN